jgi:hypothetical protein
MFDYKPTPYWNSYYASEFPYEHEVVFQFVNGGGTELDHYCWEEDISETGKLKFYKKLSEVRHRLTDEFLGYMINGYVWQDEPEASFTVFHIQKVFKEREAATKFYSDLNNYWMRAELEIQKEKQR